MNDLKLAKLREWETPQVENREGVFRRSALAEYPSELDSDT